MELRFLLLLDDDGDIGDDEEQKNVLKCKNVEF